MPPPSSGTPALHLLEDAVNGCDFLEMIKLQPPDGLTVRSSDGLTITVMAYEQKTDDGSSAAGTATTIRGSHARTSTPGTASPANKSFASLADENSVLSQREVQDAVNARVVAEHEQRGVSYKSMADTLGISRGVVANRLRNNSYWKLNEILALAVFFRAPIAEFLPERPNGTQQ